MNIQPPPARFSIFTEQRLVIIIQWWTYNEKKKKTIISLKKSIQVEYILEKISSMFKNYILLATSVRTDSDDSL